MLHPLERSSKEECFSHLTLQETQILCMKVALWMRLEKVVRAANDRRFDRMTEGFNMSESAETALGYPP